MTDFLERLRRERAARRAMTREQMLEAALRIALRNLDGQLYSDCTDAIKPRESEGPLELRWDSGDRLGASIPGFLNSHEVWEILDAADSGEDPFVEHDNWAEVFAGNVRYETAAGHQIWIFNDCDSWDYVDSVQHADGRRWEYQDSHGVRSVRGHPGDNFSPDHPKRWGLPRSWW